MKTDEIHKIEGVGNGLAAFVLDAKDMENCDITFMKCTNGMIVTDGDAGIIHPRFIMKIIRGKNIPPPPPMRFPPY